MSKEISIQELEAERLQHEVDELLALPESQLPPPHLSALCSSPGPRAKPGYNYCGNGYRRIAYLELH